MDCLNRLPNNYIVEMEKKQASHEKKIEKNNSRYSAIREQKSRCMFALRRGTASCGSVRFRSDTGSRASVAPLTPCIIIARPRDANGRVFRLPQARKRDAKSPRFNMPGSGTGSGGSTVGLDRGADCTSGAEITCSIFRGRDGWRRPKSDSPWRSDAGSLP